MQLKSFTVFCLNLVCVAWLNIRLENRSSDKTNAYLFLVHCPDLIERVLIFGIVEGCVTDVAGHQYVVAVSDLLCDLQRLLVQRLQLVLAADHSQLFTMTIVLKHMQYYLPFL